MNAKHLPLEHLFGLEPQIFVRASFFFLACDSASHVLLNLLFWYRKPAQNRVTPPFGSFYVVKLIDTE